MVSLAKLMSIMNSFVMIFSAVRLLLPREFARHSVIRDLTVYHPKFFLRLGALLSMYVLSCWWVPVQICFDFQAYIQLPYVLMMLLLNHVSIRFVRVTHKLLVFNISITLVNRWHYPLKTTEMKPKSSFIHQWL